MLVVREKLCVKFVEPDIIFLNDWQRPFVVTPCNKLCTVH